MYMMVGEAENAAKIYFSEFLIYVVSPWPPQFVSSGMEAIRTKGLLEGVCPNTSSMRTNHGQVAAVGFPFTPLPGPGHLQS